MDFRTLAIISVVALLGPLLATPRRWNIPVVIGQLAAGVIVGRTGFGLIDATDPTLTLLADVGFALIMFVAGTHVPVRAGAIRAALATGLVRAILVTVSATALGVAIAMVFGTQHAPLYIVLLASSSAALVLPLIHSLGLRGRSMLELTAQVAIADIAAIVALPLAIDPPNAGRAALGAAAVALLAVVIYIVLARLERNGSRVKLHKLSANRKFALELRIQLAILFALSAVAVFSHVSVMLAGFAFGLAVAAVGEPRRLARQLFALADGFFGPLFFVWLGASLALRDLADHPEMIVLGLVLGVATLLTHATTRVLGLPLSFGLLSAAQLGIPIAAATIGTQLRVLAPGEAAALLLGALVTIAVTAVASGWAKPRAASVSPV
ncbi:Kef-type K+ transport system, membrane component KefB [Cryobacterium flavum]|uniref:Cation:proton antiporter n=1 Tax=Cryobacterium flavum TaxID=1424659 RepID=A0A4R8V7S6_9MICO|nr:MULTISPECIES: cation:proton antiporter [Cryobacterium]TFB77552.1 cation:proton antiporter [Cryobacterium flavum]SDM48933.1 Kef-type K+ transport system, membrane component KefB [Cryobacterium flavum]